MYKQFKSSLNSCHFFLIMCTAHISSFFTVLNEITYSCIGQNSVPSNFNWFFSAQRQIPWIHLSRSLLRSPRLQVCQKLFATFYFSNRITPTSTKLFIHFILSLINLALVKILYHLNFFLHRYHGYLRYYRC